MKKVSLGVILKWFGILLGVVTLVCLAGAGLTSTETVGGVTASFSIGMGGFVFGGLKATVDAGSYSTTMNYDGGMSYFVLIGVILVIVGIVLAVLGTFFKKNGKLLSVIGGMLILVGGVCAMLIKVAGTDVTPTVGGVSASGSYTDFVEDRDIGIGAILFMVFGILSGLSVVASAFMTKKK